MNTKVFRYGFMQMTILPVHVHAIYGNKYGIKVEFITANHKITKINYKKITGYKPLAPAQLNDLKKLVNKYSTEILNDWVNFFVMGDNNIKTRTINKTIK